MTPAETIRLGLAAKELLASEVFNTVMDALKQEAFEKWVATQVEHKEAREDLYRLQLSLGLIRAKLAALSASGQVEQAKAS